MLNLIEIRRHLHANPELGLEEFETQKYLLSVIHELLEGKDFAEIKTWRTGILVYLKGSDPKKTIGWRTDIDALPIKELTGLPFASQNGKMHACGHDFHMTIALGLLEQLSAKQPKNNLLFLFQPAEETVSGGKMMYDEGAFGDWLPDEFYALHVLDSLKVGQIATNAKTLLASACEVRVKFKGKGGHAAAPHTANDALVAAAYFVTEAQTIVSRNTDPLASAVITFGEFHAGKTDNVIPEEAFLHASIRTLTQEVNLMTQKRLKEIAEGIATGFALDYEITFDQFGYLPVENNPALAKEFMDFMKKQAEVELIETEPYMFAEDFGYLLNKTTGMMFFLGVNSPAPLHSAQMTPDEAAIPIAVKNVGEFLKLKAGS